ncbi:MAG: phosphate-starvation-inducible PsiE family protein [Gloeomargaritaceae cyanobacterium C42_A2020_066]|nr:phosphate-starvation-inducible PsiE family protein [Gloeomargaritaceae cyanobacterium C42_A2020_066]
MGKRIWRTLRYLLGEQSNGVFLFILGKFESLVAKVLSVAMVIVVFASIHDLIFFLGNELFTHPTLGSKLIEILGIFLSILVALEILENVSGYLKSHVIQTELVLSTALIAVSRKLVILDIDRTPSGNAVGLGIAVLALSLSYWIVRVAGRQDRSP